MRHRFLGLLVLPFVALATGPAECSATAEAPAARPPMRPLQAFADARRTAAALVAQVEAAGAALEALKERAARGEVLGREEARELGRRKAELCAVLGRVRREEALLTPAQRAAVERRRLAAGVCPGGGTAFGLEEDAVVEVAAVLEAQVAAEAWADARRVVREWRVLAAVAPLREAARPAAERVEALARRVEAQVELEALGLRVTGVLVDPEEPARSVALVDGRVLHEGDGVRPGTPAELARIEARRVWVRLRGVLFALPAGPGGA